MKVPFLDLKPCHHGLHEEMMRAVGDVFERCNFVLGDPVAELERACAAYCDAPYAIAVASGTDALKIALKALGVGPGQGVITSPVTFVATAEAVNSLGARPFFCEVDPVSCNIDPASVRAFLETECAPAAHGPHLAHKATGAIITGMLPVYLYGQCADMVALNHIAERHNLFILEDAAQAFGAECLVRGQWKKAGALGTAAAFSFYPSKNLGGAGDGGMIVTSDPELDRACRILHVHGAARPYEFTMQGYNSRLDTLQAAVLNIKLPHVDTWIQTRRQKAAYYVDRLTQAAQKNNVEIITADKLQSVASCRLPVARGQESGVRSQGSGIRVSSCHFVVPQSTIRNPQSIVLPAEVQGCRHTYNSFDIRLHDRDGLAAFLKERGVGTNIYYPKPLHLQPVYAHLGGKPGDLPVSEAVCGSVLALPFFPEITEEQQNYVVEQVMDFFK